MLFRSMCARLIGVALFVIMTASSNLPGANRAFTLESPDTKVALVELFTSEGCSSCPPAEAWLTSLKDNPALWKRFVPVAFHVDYWDRLGWVDRFALPEFTQRQRTYAENWNASTVYTPAFVLNGEEWRPARGFPSASSETPGRLRVSAREDGTLVVSFAASREWREPLIAEVVALAADQRTAVRRGENAGRELHHEFVALALVSGELQPEADGVYVAQLVLPDATVPVAGLAAWVRPAKSLAPIQAAGGWIP